MARARFQEGRLGVEGKGSRAHYFVRFRVYLADGKAVQKKVTIGLVSKLSGRPLSRKLQL